MKLLSWMHRKLQKDATSSLQALVGGNSFMIWQQKQHLKDHIEEFIPENAEEYNEEQTTDIFPGFLTIGTLSVEPISEPPTPTFDLSHEVTDQGEMTEMIYDIKLINEELEKFLKVEADREGSTDSSRKNSQASTITFSDELKDNVDDQNSIDAQLYPLQGYLLGSSTELLEKTPKAKKEKTSLCDLFMKSTIEERSSIRAACQTQKENKKEIKSSSCLTNKTQQSTEDTSHIANYFAGQPEYFPAFKKLKKINQLFHKKIHPEINKATIAAKEPKSSKYETNKNCVDSVLSTGKSMIGCWGTLKKGKKHCSKTHVKLPQDAITKNNSDPAPDDTSGSPGREHWIRTDEEYFVLEL